MGRIARMGSKKYKQQFDLETSSWNTTSEI